MTKRPSVATHRRTHPSIYARAVRALHVYRLTTIYVVSAAVIICLLTRV